MKKSILFSFLENITSQSILPYKQLDEFNGNINAYLKYNFDSRAEFYKNKSFEMLMNDVELQPVGFSVIYSTSMHGPDNNNYLYAIELYFNHFNENVYNPILDSYITVYWENPPLTSGIEDLVVNFSSEQWVQQHYDFF
ncbi:MAG: hypothetical protein LBS50_04825 [Prevotellaceae bacterium]|jgi:hypothetical protein|nr:hypothetical protein [Prevotellaceae bacterium]